jgi:hypothetical protein
VTAPETQAGPETAREYVAELAAEPEAGARAMSPDSPYVADPLKPTDAELAAAIQRGLADGTLIDADDWLVREAGYDAEAAEYDVEPEAGL